MMMRTAILTMLMLMAHQQQQFLSPLTLVQAKQALLPLRSKSLQGRIPNLQLIVQSKYTTNLPIALPDCD